MKLLLLVFLSSCLLDIGVGQPERFPSLIRNVLQQLSDERLEYPDSRLKITCSKLISKKNSLKSLRLRPILTFPYLSLPFLTFPYLSLPFLTFLYLSLPFVAFPYLSLPILTFPYLSLPFLTFPYLSLPFLTFPYLS